MQYLLTSVIVTVLQTNYTDIVIQVQANLTMSCLPTALITIFHLSNKLSADSHQPNSCISEE